jgi:hypothetical protein
MADLTLAAPAAVVPAARALLLVTGSRTLLHNAPARDWAQGLLRRAAANLPPGSVVLQGGASGPDRWAHLAAKAAGHRVVTFLVGGARVDTHAPARRWGASDDPLVRNTALVDAAAKARDAGWLVAVMGLVDEVSETRGTDHTLRLAREAGLRVSRYAWHRPGSGMAVSLSVTEAVDG